MHFHCGNNNRTPRWTCTDPCKPEVRPDAQEESASPAWLAAPAMNARDTKTQFRAEADLPVGFPYKFNSDIITIIHRIKAKHF